MGKYFSFPTQFIIHVIVFTAIALSFIISPGTVSLSFAAPPDRNLLVQAQPPVEIEHVPGEVIVRFRKKASPAAMSAAHSEADGEEVSDIPEIGVHRVRALRGQTTEDLMRMYANNPDVEYVEPNGIVHTMQIPNDPRFSELYGLNNIGQTGGTIDADIDAPEAWDQQTGTPDVVVAVIDSGVDYNHPDLSANIWTNPGEIPGNGIDDDGNGYIDDVRGWDFANTDNNPMDDFGHGTHTAGTIAAVGNNGIGVAGVSWNARIMPLKFINAAGSGTFASAASAIMYAANMGARVASNSWGCGPSAACYSQVIEDAIAYANSKGMLFVVAAGNSNNNNDTTITYPCTSGQPNVICVAATDHRDQRATFSNYGAQTVDLGAPGVNILSTVPTIGNICCSDPSGYKYLNGTSMATPHVSGAAALLLSQSPGLSVAETRNILLASVDPVPALNGITVTGGRLNVNKALSSTFNITALPTGQTVPIGGSVTFTIRVQSLNNFTGNIGLALSSPDPTITGGFGVNPVIPPSNGFFDSTLTIATTAATARGNYVLTVSGTNDAGEIHTTLISLQVLGSDFTISVTPASQAIIPGGSTTYNVAVASVDGYNSPATLSLGGVNTNIQGVFNPNPVTPPVNGSVTSSLTLTTNSAIPAGGYTITVQGTDGVKNHTGSTVLSVIKIDLIMTTLTGPAIANSGSTITVLNKVKNNGVTNATGFYVGFYLSTDSTITMADRYLGQRYVSSLAGGGINGGNFSINIPANVAAGIYYIGAIADYSNLVMETNETNNAIAGNTITVNNPDLKVTALTGPAKGNQGAAITISDTVQNQGTGNSAGFYTGFYVSTDSTITTADRYLGRRFVSSLASGAVNSGNTTVTIPANMNGGTYYIGAIADYTNVISETDELNNTLAGNTIAIFKPDMTMVSVSGPVDAPRGSNIIISDTVKNKGAGDAGGFNVGYYLSKDAAITTADTFLGSRFITGLVSGALDSSSTNVTIPATTIAGTYYLGAISDYNGLIPESNEANNALAGNIIRITNTDLIVTAVAGPAAGDTGRVITITDTVRNQGTTGAGGNFNVGFYLTTDPAVVTTADIFLGSRVVAGLAAGTNNSGSTTVTIPATVQAGAYYIGVVVDNINVIAESDEINNGLVGNLITIAISPPDLIMTAVSGPVSSMAGLEITVSDTVLNQGTGNIVENSLAGIYLSSDPIITTADIFLGSREVIPLAAGISNSGAMKFKIPVNLIPGTYYIGAIADYDNKIVEIDETNNTFTGNVITITP